MAGSREDRAAWDAVAAFWHERMGEGNHFVEVLIWPAIRRLLTDLRGARILDAGCGNGLYARRLAAEGARVTAVDYSEHMIAHARAATPNGDVDYHVLDVTDPEALAGLPDGGFDAVVSTMAMMDISDIRPLFRRLPGLLRPGGAFVFATAHPSFNSPNAGLHPGEADTGAGPTPAHARIMAYRTASRAPAIAIRGQPAETWFFHRSMAELLRPGFEAGLVMDALEEPAFPPDHPDGSKPDSWGGRFNEFPAVLVGRFRNPGDAARGEDRGVG